MTAASARTFAAADSDARYGKGYLRLLLGLLLLGMAVNFMDRTIISTIALAIKADLSLTDTQLGLLQGLAFALLYSVLGIPVARLADRTRRVTILSAAKVVWSTFTILCGSAQTFVQLLLYRLGVGVGEAGYTAPAQSLIADHFPPEKRTLAISIVTCGIPLGILVGAVSAGWITEHLSWRTAFLLVGLPGLALGLAFPLLVREPPRGHSDPGTAAIADADAPTIGAVVSRMLAARAFVHMALGTIVGTFSFIGLTSFLAAHFVRNFHLGFGATGLLVGLMIGVVQGTGIVVGAYATQRLARRDYRWQALLPGLGLLVVAPLAIAAFLADDLVVAVALLAPSWLFHFYLSPTVAVLHGLLEPRMRATGSAILLLLVNLVGTGLGPLFTGGLIDLIAGHAAPDIFPRCADAAQAAAAGIGPACAAAVGHGTRWALAGTAAVSVWAAVHFLLASRTLTADLARIRAAALPDPEAGISQ